MRTGTQRFLHWINPRDSFSYKADKTIVEEKLRTAEDQASKFEITLNRLELELGVLTRQKGLHHHA